MPLPAVFPSYPADEIADAYCPLIPGFMLLVFRIETQ